MRYSSANDLYVSGKDFKTPMMYDIALLQQKYGANVADWGSNTHVINGGFTAHTIWDGGGLGDSINASNVTSAALTANGISFNKIDLRGGVGTDGKPIFSQVGNEAFAIALDPRTNWTKGIVIEHVVGSASIRNHLTGNDAGNSLTGGIHADTLLGGLGNDTLTGGAGNDVFIFNYQSSGTDTVTDFNAAGNASTGEKLDFSAFGINSAQLSSIAAQVGADTHITLDSDYKIVLKNVTVANVLDNATGLVTGTTGNHAIGDTGNNAINKIVAGANGLRATIYNDTLTGEIGADTLDSAEGSDTYIWQRGHGNDLIKEVLTLTDVNKLRLEEVSKDDIRVTYEGDTTLQIQVLSPNGTAETITFDQAQRIPATTKADVSKGFAIRFLELDDAIIDLTKGITIRPLQNSNVAYGMEGLIADDTFLSTGPQGSLSLNGFEGNDTYIVDFNNSPQNTYISDISGFNSLIVRNSVGYSLSVTDSTLNGNRLYAYTKTLNETTTIKQIIIINYNAHSKQWGSRQDEHVLMGSAAQDMLLDLIGNSTITSGAGNDTIQFVREANAADTITDFTVGQDKIDLSHASFSGLQYNALSLSTTGGNAVVYLGDNQQIRVNGISHTSLTASQFKFATSSAMQGTSGNDTLNGTSAANHILGLDGNDTLNGGNGADSIDGGADADLLYGEDGSDYLQGNVGTDTVYGGAGGDSLRGGSENDVLYGEADNDTLSGDLGDDTLWGGDGNDTLYGSDGADSIDGGDGLDFLYGEAGADYLQGNTGADAIYGGAGHDTLRGGSEADALYGDADNDTLKGDIGDDTLCGGTGTDALTGGAGIDRFIYTATTESGIGSANRDVISDFVAGTDDINLSSFAGTFVYRGTNAFTGASNQVRYYSTGSDTIVEVDTNADGVANMEIELTGLLTLAAGDFIL